MYLNVIGAKAAAIWKGGIAGDGSTSW